MREAALVVGVLLPGLAAGCGTPFNERIEMSAEPALPALSAGDEPSVLSARPSIGADFDRRGWPRLTVRVPVGGVGHGPTYAASFRWRGDRGPWSPAYPTATGSVVDETDGAADLADALTQPIVSAGLLLWMPIDMATGRWPWSGERSPAEPYDRVGPRRGTDVGDWFSAASSSAPEIQWRNEPAPAGPR